MGWARLASLLLALLCLALIIPALAGGRPPKTVPDPIATPSPEVSQLASINCPAGTNSWFGNFDYYGDWWEWTWAFDHPVSLIFLSTYPLYAYDVESILASSDLGFSSLASEFASDGALSVGTSYDSDPSTFENAWARGGGEPGVKKDLTDSSTVKNSFFHVRAYAPNGTFWQTTWPTGQHVYMVVATCHVDVNEGWFGDDGRYQPLPPECPPPSNPALSIYSWWQFGGNSEFVEDYIANKWAASASFGPGMVEEDSVWLGNAVNAFEVRGTYSARVGKRTGTLKYGVAGKWWKSNGMATVLWVHK